MGLTEVERRVRVDALAWFDDHRDEFVSTLVDWVRIPSVSRADLAAPGAPFGPDVARMLHAIMDSAVSAGLEVDAHDGYALSLRYGADGHEIGLISHVDVVPAGDGWRFDPFEPTVRDGYVIGRGVRDNKGAALLDLWLLRFFRDRGHPLRCGLRVILGGAEETGMADLEHYVRTARVPDVSLVTDGFFPVNHVQHGRITVELRLPWSVAGGLLSTDGTTNSVPARARARFEDAEVIARLERALHREDSRRDGIQFGRKGDALVVEAAGLAGHPAFPGSTVNAVAVLAEFLTRSQALSGGDQSVADLLARLLGDQYGVGAGLDRTDDSGRLTLNGGALVCRDGSLHLTMTIRHPVQHEARDIVRELDELVVPVGGAVDVVSVVPPHVVPADDPTVELLRATFDDLTGATTRPMAMGGGTHARVVPNAHTFGPGMFTEQAIAYAARRQADFLPDGHGDPHGPDECVAIDNLRMAFGIYAVAIIRLDELVGQDEVVG